MRHLLCVILLGLSCQSDPQPDPAGNEDAPDASRVHPIVDVSEHQLFGAVRDGEWLEAGKAAGFVRRGQRYRVYSMTDTLGVYTVARLEPSDETCSTPAVFMQDRPEGDSVQIAVAGAWNALPRVSVPQDTAQQVYREIVADYLRRHEIAVAEVELEQVLRIDLEGDGTDEVLITANRLRGSGTMALSGDYALVLLRKVIEGEVHQIPLEEEYYVEGCVADCAPSSFRVSAVLDVDGDGVMEVVTGFRYFEGRGKRIHEVAGRKARPVLSWRCGV